MVEGEHELVERLPRIVVAASSSESSDSVVPAMTRWLLTAPAAPATPEGTPGARAQPTTIPTTVPTARSHRENTDQRGCRVLPLMLLFMLRCESRAGSVRRSTVSSPPPAARAASAMMPMEMTMFRATMLMGMTISGQRPTRSSSRHATQRPCSARRLAPWGERRPFKAGRLALSGPATPAGPSSPRRHTGRPVRTDRSRWRPSAGCCSLSCRIVPRMRMVTAERARSLARPCRRSRPAKPRASARAPVRASISRAIPSARPASLFRRASSKLRLEVADAGAILRLGARIECGRR